MWKMGYGLYSALLTDHRIHILGKVSAELTSVAKPQTLNWRIATNSHAANFLEQL